jgi:DNA-binding IclR family transcriptional regulator
MAREGLATAQEATLVAHTFEELKAKTIAELREMAKGIGHDAVKGYSQMNKEHLLPALCQALGIDAHVHHHVEGIDKAGLKARLRALKAERAEALAAKDYDRLKAIRRQHHRLNRQIRAHLV